MRKRKEKRIFIVADAATGLSHSSEIGFLPKLDVSLGAIATHFSCDDDDQITTTTKEFLLRKVEKLFLLATEIESLMQMNSANDDDDDISQRNNSVNAISTKETFLLKLVGKSVVIQFIHSISSDELIIVLKSKEIGRSGFPAVVD